MYCDILIYFSCQFFLMNTTDVYLYCRPLQNKITPRLRFLSGVKFVTFTINFYNVFSGEHNLLHPCAQLLLL